MRVVIAETVLLACAVAVAVALAGWTWLVPMVIAAPLIAVEFSFDIRSRGRRLIPELCGAVGISAVAASIVIVAGQDGGLAAGLWLVLAARAVGAIPFVRVQIVRLRRGRGPVWQSDLAQAVSLVVATGAVVADRRMLLGALGVAVLAAAQCRLGASSADAGEADRSAADGHGAGARRRDRGGGVVVNRCGLLNGRRSEW